MAIAYGSAHEPGQRPKALPIIGLYVDHGGIVVERSAEYLPRFLDLRTREPLHFGFAYHERFPPVAHTRLVFPTFAR